MTAFSITACLMLAAALFFILPTLLRTERRGQASARRDELNLEVLRDQFRELDADLASGTLEASAYDSARQELERRVAEDVLPSAQAVGPNTSMRTPAVVIGLAVSILSASLYLYLGTPSALDPVKLAAAESAGHPVTADQIGSMTVKLAERLKEKPDDAEGWNMLARSYGAIGRFAEAADAYAHLVKLIPDNADVLADYADALGMSLNKSLLGEPEKIALRAVAVDPNNIKALALAGSAAFERRDYPGAIVHWKKILTIVPPDSEASKQVASNVAEAQSLMGGKPAEQAPPAVVASAASTAPASSGSAAASQVAGTVELDPALRSQAADSDTVFIFVRAAEGSRAPLVVLRKQVKDLPTSFVMDDSMSMTTSAKLSSFPIVVVGARVSKSGNAVPAPGDLEGLTEPVKLGKKDLKIRISSRRS
jgi:cytochrome c-type biogenesis protein CcmH